MTSIQTAENIESPHYLREIFEFRCLEITYRGKFQHRMHFESRTPPNPLPKRED